MRWTWARQLNVYVITQPSSTKLSPRDTKREREEGKKFRPKRKKKSATFLSPPHITHIHLMHIWGSRMDGCGAAAAWIIFLEPVVRQHRRAHDSFLPPRSDAAAAAACTDAKTRFHLTCTHTHTLTCVWRGLWATLSHTFIHSPSFSLFPVFSTPLSLSLF